MKYLAILLLILGFGLSGFAQTIKSLGYNTTNGQVVYSGTNLLTFTNAIVANNIGFFSGDFSTTISGQGLTFYSDFSTNIQSMILFDGDQAETMRSIFRTNIGLGWSALTNTNAATSLLGFTTNGQVVANTGTNTLTFTNRFGQSSTNATNPPEIRLTTKSNAVASWFYYDAFGAGSATNATNDKDWSVMWIGNNHVVSGNGQDYTKQDFSKGAISLTIENMYYSTLQNNATNTNSVVGHVGEFYINIDGYTGTGNTRAFFIAGSQTNSSLGNIFFSYPVTFNYNNNSRFWSGADNFGINVYSTNSGLLSRIQYNGTNANEQVLFRMQIQDAATDFWASRGTFYIRNYEAGRNALHLSSNGVVLGATDANLNAAAPIHLAGNARIDGSITFNATSNAATTRNNLGFDANLNTLWTATNASNARSAISIGDTNAVAFSGIYNNGNFTNINGTIYGLKTNVGPFEGIGNFFASNNTTVSNETLFRVGLAEATNKSAQFGFRVTRTNNGGEGVAVYSIFGYNALMMIGPSDRSRINYATNTNAGIEATLWTITPTNQVMTLRDTNTGATTLHQSLGFDTNVTSTAPANTTNIVKWIEVWVGTNSYRMPLYQ